MGQAPLVVGVENNGGTEEIFLLDQVLNATDLSAAFNQAIQLVNGNLSDTNVRARDVVGGYFGILESKIAWSDSDGVGHNHDGVNSARLAPATVGENQLISEAEFLRHPLAEPLAAQGSFLACGHCAFSLLEDAGGTLARTDIHAIDIGVTYDANAISGFSNLRCHASLVFNDPEGGAGQTTLWNTWSIIVDDTISTTYPGVLLTKVYIIFDPAIVAVDNVWDENQGPIGVTYAITGIATYTDPLA